MHVAAIQIPHPQAAVTYDLDPEMARRSRARILDMVAAERMAESKVGRLPVVSPDDPHKVVGVISRSDLLKPRARQAEEERRRERFIDAGRFLPMLRRR